MIGLENIQVHLVTCVDDAAALLRWLGERHENNIIGFDTETEGLQWWHHKCRLMQFGDTVHGWVIPWERWGGVAEEVFRKYDGPIVGHNLKFDAHIFEAATGQSFNWRNAHDTMVMSHLVDPVESHALKSLCSRFIDKDAARMQGSLDAAMQTQNWTWATVPINFQAYWAYAALDPILTCKLYGHFAPTIRDHYARLYEIEIQVLRILCGMERRGIRLDIPHINRSIAKLQQYVADMKAYIATQFGVTSPGSSAQLVEFFTNAGFKLTKMTPTAQYAMDVEVLEMINHPLADAILAYRRTTKIISTYLENFVELADGEYLHCSINSLGARTGRMSISEPSLQNLPRQADRNPASILVRDSFIPSPGNRLISCDFDQIEYRLLCHFAESGLPEEQQLVKRAILSGDIHTTTARQVFNDPTIDKKDPRRQITKNAVFARLYGAGVDKFAATARIPVDDAAAFYAAYDQAFPTVTTFTDRVQRIAWERHRAEGFPYVRTPAGRLQPTKAHDIKKIYVLVNYLIQGCAADIMKQALVRLDAAGFGEYMILPIHDEELFDMPVDMAVTALPEIEKVMGDDEWLVPITAGGEVYERWGDKYRK